MLTPARYIREHILDMPQTDLARELGISQARLSKIESKKIGVIPEHHRAKVRELAQAKGVEIPDADFEKLPLKRGR